MKKVDVSGGMRFDTRSIESYHLLLDSLGRPIDTVQSGMTVKFSHFFASFSNISGSIGIAYSISEKVYTKLNVSRGFRSPNLAELASNGVHEGTFRYELGN